MTPAKRLIPIFCLLHAFAISWWTLPYSFSNIDLGESGQTSLETKLLKGMRLDGYPKVASLLQKYIDLTGSQQYWDFFAPQSSRYHQYISVCGSSKTYLEEGEITCTDKPFFSNLDIHFSLFGSGRSRLYRLTENLAKLEHPVLLRKFAQYHQFKDHEKFADNTPLQLVLHQFELHPELKDLPKVGYRMDNIIWSGN
jgi:hypothetical protein